MPRFWNIKGNADFRSAPVEQRKVMHFSRLCSSWPTKPMQPRVVSQAINRSLCLFANGWPILASLAVQANVAASTQNQAMNALVFLYRQVLKIPLDEKIDAVRAERKVNAPVVLTREEVANTR
jgi:Phage integrase, N-terminal SAM-like domain